MNNHRYFGTDGIRGKVGNFPIVPDFILKLGWAVGKVLSHNGSRKIIVGKDTRISGYMFESAIEAGLSAAGLSAVFTGPMPTPAIAYLTRILKAEAGIVISASHNPFYDNGIKIFSINGTKINEEVEIDIETELAKPLTCVDSTKLGRSSCIANAAERYINFCKETFPSYLNLNGLKIVVDCANGSTYHIAPVVLKELGANVITLGCQPNGININYKCGTNTGIHLLQARVLAEKADLGIAYDGDGDRVIMVDHMGQKIDGDQILYIITKEKLRQGYLLGGVVGTTMSNMGLELALKQLGVPFVRSRIGDRYVFKKMQEIGWYLGAESSGHVILLDKTTTGDGIIAGLQVLSIIVSRNIHLHDLCSNIYLLPQVLINVRFTGLRNPLESLIVQQVSAKVQKQLAGRGRMLLRKSGTEPMIRVMVEGEDKEQISFLAHQIADAIKSASLR